MEYIIFAVVAGTIFPEPARISYSADVQPSPGLGKHSIIATREDIRLRISRR